MKEINKHNLRLRFKLGLIFIIFNFCAISATLLYFHQKNFITQESFRQTELVLASVEATRNYVSQTLRPRMYEIIEDDRFIIEAMSTSYVSRVVMDRLKEEAPEFDYKRVAINARNPNFEAQGSALKMIRYFSINPEEDEWSGIITKENKSYFMMARPVVFQALCLRCHGKPEDAPRDIIDSYGSILGFNHKIGEIAGVMSVSIPIETSLTKIRWNAYVMFGTIFTVALLLYLAIWIFFDRLVVSELRSLLNILKTTPTNKKEIELYNSTNKDEMNDLFVSAKNLARHLNFTRRQLADHSENLETEIIRRTEALEKYRTRRTEKMVALGQLASGVAHEINNPLSVILCYSDLLKVNNKDNSEAMEDIAVIERHALNCRRIVQDLLDFARNHDSEKKLSSLNTIVTEVATMLKQKIMKKQLEFDLNLAKDLPHCYMDSGRIKQVILNLALNAIQATSNGGMIRITTEKSNSQHVALYIEDDGTGIKTAIIPKIFDPFFTTKQKESGSGLGLAVSYGIIKEHNGNINVYSEYGQGAVFMVTLPTNSSVEDKK